MSKKLVIAAFVVLGALSLGLGAYLFVDPDSKPGSRASGGRPGQVGQAAPGSPEALGNLPSKAPALGETKLDPQAEATLRESLERAARDSSEREALQGGVPNPWPIAQARDAFRICLGNVASLVDTKVLGASEQACACATRAVQRNHPKKPPDMSNRNGRRGFERELKDAVETCTGN